MASGSSFSVTKHFAALFRTGTATGLTDGSLLDRIRLAGGRSFDSHESASSDQLGGGLVIDGRRRGRRGDGAAESAGAPEQPPPPVVNDNKYRVTMAGGATFEVLALLSHYSSPKMWWRPDGTPLGEVPADRSLDVYFGTTGEVLVDILVRVKDLPKDSTLKWVPTYDSQCLTYKGGVTKDGKRIPELFAYVASFRPDRTICSVQIQFAAGPWKTEASDGVRFGGGTVIKDGHEFHFGLARAYQGGSTVAVAHNLADADIHIRLVAVDSQGKEYPAHFYSDAAAQTARSFVNHFGKELPANYSSGSRREILGILDTEFALTPEQIREFRVPVPAVRAPPRSRTLPCSRVRPTSPHRKRKPSRLSAGAAVEPPFNNRSALTCNRTVA